MANTKTTAKMSFVDVSALEDAFIATSANQPFGNSSFLKEQIDISPYGTLELNQFILDGSKSIMPESPADVAFWSADTSLANCSYTDNPTFTITFTQKHSSAGITLYFGDSYPGEIKITWYSLYGTKLDEQTFNPDAATYVCDYQVSQYGKIVIEITKSFFPYWYGKLQYILYGIDIEWSDEMIQSASVTEELDVTSGTISINTAQIAIVDENNDFDIGNDNGAWRSVQKQQEVSLQEHIDDSVIDCGTFYIDDFSFQENIATFSLIDAVGLMDKTNFEDGTIYSNVKAGVIIDSIMSSCGITKYTIDSTTYDTYLSGYLTIQTHREALQQVVFACGSLVDCSRSDYIEISKPTRYVESVVSTDRKFTGTKTSLDEYVSGVSITCNKYALETDTSEIYNDILYTGDNKLLFSDPYLVSSITISTGTIKAVKTNYIIVTMTADGTCAVNGRKYASSEFSIQKSVSTIDAGETANIKEFGTCTLYNVDGLKDIADSLLNYYELRKLTEMRYLINLEQVGKWCDIKDINDNYYNTLIESQTLDLTGGFIAQATCRGYSKNTSIMHYTGEIYTGTQWHGL